MFDRLLLTFYSADSIENWGVCLLYDGEAKANTYDLFAVLFYGITR